MNRKEIEAKDQVLIKKFRSIVENKKKRPLWRPYHFWLPLLLTGLIIGGLIFFKPPPQPLVAENSTPVSRDSLKENTPPVLENPINLKGIPAVVVIKPEVQKPGKEGLLFSRKPVLPEKELPLLTAPEPNKEALSIASSSETKMTILPDPPEQGNRSPIIQISEIVSCSSVSNRQYVSPKKEFSLKEIPTPVVWMSVLSDIQPFTLTHVYYINGQKHCEVPLNIRYQRMRTWSKVSLNNPEHLGKWRVDVMTDTGEKLDQIEFVIVE